ncbi:40S ribosomal protein S29-like [Rousettus aegyptiacus]|uniref:40S ribosomal protein S29-like n=1 Tax=Rousettus aegyptiacus TaxID=9407 RepID=UPI00168D2D5D|nr:40S ribosomal protein S29-like [Rousettus aegyptiacus]
MGHRHLYWSHLRKFSQGSHSCCICSNWHGLFQKYGLNMCCQCFCEYVKDIDFIKFDEVNFHEWVIPDIYCRNNASSLYIK